VADTGPRSRMDSVCYSERATSCISKISR
jgi:hypothetical protein